jgi:hypothetical protein
MVLKCYNKPNRKKPRVYTARDVGRITAYARQDGADDAELLAQIMKAFGQKELSCAVFRILDVLNTAFFLGAIIGLLKGIMTLLKAVKIISTGKKSAIATSMLEVLIPAKFKGQLAALLLWLGSAEVATSALIIFLTAIANNVAIYLLAKGICETLTPDFNIEVQPLEVGDLKSVLDLTWSELVKSINE